MANKKKETIKGKSKSVGKVVTKKTTNTKRPGDTPKQKATTVIKRKPMDPKTMEILAALAVLLIIVSYFTLGLITTLILVVGIALILFFGKIIGKAYQKGRKRKVLNIVMITILSLGILVAVTGSGFLVYVVATAPEFDTTRLNTKESTVFYNKDNGEIQRLGSELRENISYDDLPQVFVDALIATEDSRFFQHNGFDAPRFLKASLKQIASGGDEGGGASTISMQVIKNSFTDDTNKGIKGIIRKFTDIYLAIFKLEKNYTKEQIIEFYVNNHCLGGTVCGVEQAAQTYFGKSIRDVNLAEASLLAGMFQAPTSYNPYVNPDKATERRSTVLYLMQRHGYISQEEAEIASAISVESLLVGKTASEVANLSYIDTVIEELQDKYDVNPLVTPLLVYTNMDQAKQDAIDSIFNGTGGYSWVDDVIQSGVAVVEVDTGKIVAVGAGRNRVQRGRNYATMRNMIKRQIGSTAKPIFDYGPGIEYLNWSTYQQFVDEPWSYTNGPSINNSDGKFMGQISLRTALAQSRNIPALKAFQQNDNSKIISFAESLGITPEVSNGYLHEAHALGAFNGATPIEMAAAYAAFANGGYYTEPYTVSKIVYRETGEEKTLPHERVQVMSEATAFMISDVLKTAVTNGLSSGASIKGVNLAAKTGTTNFPDETREAFGLPNNAVNDAWIVGYDTQYALSMWYGYDTIDKTHWNSNNEAVVQRSKLYRALGEKIFNKNGSDFQAPSSVVKVGIEVGSNPPLLPSANTPTDQITYEYFKVGTEPTEISTKYQKLDTVTGLKYSYDKENQKLTLSWNRIATPSGNADYGKFGYRIYYNNTLLGFTEDNTYTIDTASPDGTYKVVSAFENYTANQSDAAQITVKEDENETDSSKYEAALNGKRFVSLAVGDTYEDPNPPISVVDENKNNITDEVIKANGITTVIRDENNKVVEKIDSTKVGSYTITYTVNYKGFKVSLTRSVAFK